MAGRAGAAAGGGRVAAMRKGCDYSWARPPPAVLKAAGVTFVVRYVADTPGNPGKQMTLSEARALSAAGLDVACVYQTTKSFMLSGRAGGVADARAAAVNATAAGMPPHRPIYFAADWDVTTAQMPTVLAFLDGASMTLGPGRVGVYGGFRTVTAALAHWARTRPGDYLYTWQTRAWSGGKWAPVNLRQTVVDTTAQPVIIAGARCDWDEAHAGDFGQWRTGVNEILPADTSREAALDGHAALAAPTGAELAAGAELGAVIDPDDDTDIGPLSLLSAAAVVPPAAVLARAQGLKAALLAAGVPQVSIELMAGRPSPDVWGGCHPRTNFAHHIVSRYSAAGSLTPLLSLIKLGRTDLPGPLANGYGGWDLCARIITCGYANHPGTGGPIAVGGFVIPADSARPHAWGWEFEGGLVEADWDRVLTNPATGKRMTMREFMGRCGAGLQNFHKLARDAHLEHSTWTDATARTRGRKNDRLNYTRARGVAEINRYANAAPTPPEVPDLDANQAKQLAELHATLVLKTPTGLIPKELAYRNALVTAAFEKANPGQRFPDFYGLILDIWRGRAGIVTILAELRQLADRVDDDLTPEERAALAVDIAARVDKLRVTVEVDRKEPPIPSAAAIGEQEEGTEH